MGNLNRRGFALVETLVVSAFVMGIFTLLYTNYYPLIGEYEKRENYDNIDMVYKTDIIKKFIMKNKQKPLSINAINQQLTTSKSFCKYFQSLQYPDQCTELWKVLKVNSILLTTYSLKERKEKIRGNSNISQSIKEYVDYLPNYDHNPYKYTGRIIVEYKESVNGADESSEYTVYKYATLGVDLYDNM